MPTHPEARPKRRAPLPTAVPAAVDAAVGAPSAWLDVPGAAAYTNTSTRFVRRLIAERRVPFHKLGAKVRIARADLDAFVAAGRVEATNGPGAA